MKSRFVAIISIALAVTAAMTVAQTPIQPPAGVAGLCSSPQPMSDPAAGVHWNGWGASAANTRFQQADQAGLTAAGVPKLKVKWAFGFPNATRARSQPTIAGGRLFVANETGAVYALDPKTGCTYWTFQAQGDVRTAISAGPRRGPGGAAEYTVYFADGKSNAY